MYDKVEGYDCEDYELTAHKRSDKVKWVVSFLLIFVLLAGLVGAWVMLLKPFHLVGFIPCFNYICHWVYYAKSIG